MCNSEPSNTSLAILVNRSPCFGWLSVGVLSLLVYVNTAVVAAEAPVVYQLLLACMITIVWFSLVRMRLASAIFASVALMPATLFGVGFFMLPGMALTLSDLFTLIAICLYLLRPQTLYRDRFIILLWLLVLVCVLSDVAAANPIAHVGSIMRLILSVALLTIVLGSAGDSLRRHVTMAFLAWPFVMLTYLAAQEGYLWKFLSFSDGESLRVLETGNLLLGSHLIVSYLLFCYRPALLFRRCAGWCGFLYRIL